MTFSEKLNSYFSNPVIKLATPPARHLLHLYADYVELVALFSNRTYISGTDVLDRFKDEGIIRQTEKGDEQAESNDDNEKFLEQIFRILRDRVELFESNYPFQIRDHDKIILKEEAEITGIQKIYVFLLLSSSLNVFNLFQPELTKEFELVCKEVLENYLPEAAIIKSFGKNSEYTGTAEEKIKSLAKDLNIQVDEAVLEQFSKKGTQERGLDLIGWLPFQDKTPNLLSVLCQCTCTKEWYKKLNETLRYENYYKFHRNKPLHSMFIPYSLIDYHRNEFFQNDEIHNSLVFERKRILNFINDTAFFDNLETKGLVERCIGFEEDIV